MSKNRLQLGPPVTGDSFRILVVLKLHAAKVGSSAQGKLGNTIQSPAWRENSKIMIVKAEELEVELQIWMVFSVSTFTFGLR
jgi:hypothetical protein